MWITFDDGTIYKYEKVAPPFLILKIYHLQNTQKLRKFQNINKYK